MTAIRDVAMVGGGHNGLACGRASQDPYIEFSQGEMTPDQMFSLRPVFGFGDYRSPVSGLYLCGSGTHPGGGVMAAPARNASRVILADVRRDRLRGRLRPPRRPRPGTTGPENPAG